MQPERMQLGGVQADLEAFAMFTHGAPAHDAGPFSSRRFLVRRNRVEDQLPHIFGWRYLMQDAPVVPAASSRRARHTGVNRTSRLLLQRRLLRAGRRTLNLMPDFMLDLTRGGTLGRRTPCT
jgi:hypothetical protein